MAEREDRQLFAQIAKGDARAFRQLVDAHAGPLLTYVTRIMGNQAEAEEVVQEVFLKVWQKADSYNGSARATTWLHRIAHNLAIDSVRTRKGVRELDPEFDGAPGSERPAALLEQKQRVTSLAEALDKLPERQKQALLLRYEQNLRDSEIGEVLGLSVDATESLLARARKNVQKLLPEEV